ncbi:jg598 [Pararge aegeria aegeria]|uniref:Jg598 protein n=1 Tax=Pararge aegeria aegeria TaxID=348720 RepID=A0A8S4QWM8_9NEOP|nr:jg598 [Pararge aegeria aegeria]
MGGAHSSENRWTLGFQGAGRPRSGKRSFDRPPTRWTDDIKQIAGSHWQLAAQDRGFWNSLQKTYVEHSTRGLQSVEVMMLIQRLRHRHQTVTGLVTSGHGSPLLSGLADTSCA